MNAMLRRTEQSKPQSRPAINPNAAERIEEQEVAQQYAKANTPEERAERFSRLATAKTRLAIRAIRGVGKLVTGYAVFSEEQADAIRGALQNEVDKVHGTMLERLTRGSTINDIHFRV